MNFLYFELVSWRAIPGSAQGLSPIGAPGLVSPGNVPWTIQYKGSNLGLPHARHMDWSFELYLWPLSVYVCVLFLFWDHTQKLSVLRAFFLCWEATVVPGWKHWGSLAN